MNEKSGVPATIEAAPEDTGLPARQAEVAGAVATVISADWGDLAKMSRAQADQVAKVLLTSYPQWGAAEVLRFVSVLGGKLYFTAEFWEDVANTIKEYAGAIPRRLHPEDKEWKDFAGKTEVDAIAALVVTEGFRHDRKYPVIDFNYVMKDDAILYDYYGARGTLPNRVAGPRDAIAGFAQSLFNSAIRHPFDPRLHG